MRSVLRFIHLHYIFQYSVKSTQTFGCVTHNTQSKTVSAYASLQKRRTVSICGGHMPYTQMLIFFFWEIFPFVSREITLSIFRTIHFCHWMSERMYVCAIFARWWWCRCRACDGKLRAHSVISPIENSSECRKVSKSIESKRRLVRHRSIANF